MEPVLQEAGSGGGGGEHQGSGADVPDNGHWPAGPQEAQTVSKDRIWIDGCFDFSHHGEYRQEKPVVAWPD